LIVRLAAYLRVSTDRQAEFGLGLDVQERAIRTWARVHGHTIDLWTQDEGQSGSNGIERRHGLMEALEAAGDPRFGGLVVYRLDRLARDLVLQEQLLAEVWRTSSRVFSTSPSEDAYLDPEGAELDPSRELIRQVLGAVASYERKMIRLRMNSGKARKRESGGFVGGQIPYGYDSIGGRLVASPDEQAALERIGELHAEGLSLRSIASTLAAEGHKPKRSPRWHPETVRQLIAASGGDRGAPQQNRS